VSPVSIANRAADFRYAFDKTFASRHASGSEAGGEDFLMIRIGGDGYAIRLREITGLIKGRRVVACPSQAPEFIGIAGVRGMLVSVYSLPALLGYNISAEHAPWLILCSDKSLESAEGHIAVAFPEFSGFVHALPAQLHSGPDWDAASRQSMRTTQFLRVGDEVRPIVAISRLLTQCLSDANPARVAQIEQWR